MRHFLLKLCLGAWLATVAFAVIATVTGFAVYS